ncbi:MAG: MopE-related protein [Myxococcota bacterium]
MRTQTQLSLIIWSGLLGGCNWGHWLYNKRLYDKRLAELTDNDGDGFSFVDGDCDDQDETIAPGLAERCDGIDNNCDGIIDEDSVDETEWYFDRDEDGFGDSAQQVTACAPPAEYVADGGDCDDLDGEISPSAEEICNDGVDNDCDGTDNGCGLTGTFSTEDADHFLFGAAEGDGVGVSMVGGDLNGDGYGDLLIGALHGNAAYVASGRDLDRITFFSQNEGSFTRAPELPDDYILAQSVGVCDVDNDGWHDALITGLRFGERSEVWVFNGPLTRDLTTADADIQLQAEEGSDFLGSDFSCGDIDGDGTNDLLIGAGLHSTSDYSEAGAVYLLNSTDLVAGEQDIIGISHKISGDETLMHLGAYVSLADINGDGDLDGLLSATEATFMSDQEGGLFVFYTIDEKPPSLDESDVQFQGVDPKGRFAVLSTGDINGDGYMDIVLGGDRIDSTSIDAGGVYVYSGRPDFDSVYSTASADSILLGEREGDRLGIGVEVTDDIDRDGSREVAVSAGFADTPVRDAGSVLLYDSLRMEGETLDVSDNALDIQGTDRSGLLGFMMSGDADLDNDGYPDFAMTGLGYDEAGENAGAVFVISGAGL